MSCSSESKSRLVGFSRSASEVVLFDGCGAFDGLFGAFAGDFAGAFFGDFSFDIDFLF